MLTDGFRQLGRTLRELKAYPLTLFFLLAFLVYNDGIQTVIALASQYGTEELRLEQDTLVITILLVQFLAFGGALGCSARWPRRIGAWKTVLLSLVLWTVRHPRRVPAAGRGRRCRSWSSARRSGWCSAAARR